MKTALIEGNSEEEAFLRRAIIDACEEVIRLAKHPGKHDGAMILDIAEARLFNIREDLGLAGDPEKAKSLDVVVGQAMHRIGEHFNGGEPKAVTGLRSGFDDIDSFTSGFHPGEMVLLASRPSMGRLALAINMVDHIAIDYGNPVLIFSLDVPAIRLTTQFLSSRSKIAYSKLQHGQLSRQEMETLAVVADILSKSSVFIVDAMIRGIPDLRAQMRRIHRKCNGLGLIVIDSLQQLSETICTEETKVSIDALLRTIKALAREMSVPILVLSELSRMLEERDDKRPLMMDLRSHGVNDQAADMVLMLYRDEYYNLDSDDPGITEILIQKNCNGPTGVAFLKTHMECCRFDHLAGLVETSSDFVP